MAKPRKASESVIDVLGDFSAEVSVTLLDINEAAQNGGFSLEARGFAGL